MNTIIHNRTPAHAPSRVFDSIQTNNSQPLPHETARVLVGFAPARTSQGVRAFSSKFAGKTQVGKPKPGAPVPNLCQDAPGSGFLLVFLLLALCVMIAGTAWAVLG